MISRSSRESSDPKVIGLFIGRRGLSRSGGGKGFEGRALAVGNPPLFGLSYRTARSGKRRTPLQSQRYGFNLPSFSDLSAQPTRPCLECRAMTHHPQARTRRLVGLALSALAVASVGYFLSPGLPVLWGPSAN